MSAGWHTFLKRTGIVTNTTFFGLNASEKMESCDLAASSPGRPDPSGAKEQGPRIPDFRKAGYCYPRYHATRVITGTIISTGGITERHIGTIQRTSRFFDLISDSMVDRSTYQLNAGEVRMPVRPADLSG